MLSEKELFELNDFLGLSTELSRPICECDKQLIKQLRTLEPTNAQFPVSKCVKGSFRNTFSLSLIGTQFISLSSDAD